MGSSTDRDISCRVARTLLSYVRENNAGSLGDLLEGLDLDEAYLLDTDNWVSHDFLLTLYDRMIALLKDENAVYHMALASHRLEALGMLDRIARMVGSPRLLYSRADTYNKLLKLNGDVYIHEIGDSWVLLEDRYHAGETKTRHDCDYTRGILEGIPTLFDMPPAHVEEIECQVRTERYGSRFWKDSPRQGATGCLYRVTWDAKSKPSFWNQVLKYGIYFKALHDLDEANRKIQDKYNEASELASRLQKSNDQLDAARIRLGEYLQRLEASESRYRLLAENISDIIWTFDLTRQRFTYISPSVERYRGFTADEAMALTLEETISPESMPEVASVIAEELARENDPVANSQRSRTFVVSQICKDKSLTWGEVTATFLRDSEGHPVGFLGVTRDINQRKQAEEERQALQERLQRAEKMEALGTLAGGVAHDLNNVLGVIIGFSELLLAETPESDKARSRLLNIMKGSQRAAAIVQDLLTMARRGVSTHKIVNLNDMVLDTQNAPEFLKMLADHYPVRIKTNLAKDLLNVAGSPVHLNKTILNLLINALEAMPKTEGGEITITTSNRYMDEPVKGYDHIQEGDYAVLSVSDTGEGIAAADLKRIFEPFYTKKVMGRSGTGLGLAIVWGTVKDHNGYINVQSAKGEGTTITLYFPVTREQASEEGLVAAVSTYTGRGETILVVDDVSEQRDLACDMLQKLNYWVAAVASGEEAVEYLQKHRADIIVLDMIMSPGMDGLDTYRKILEIVPGQKAVIVSGFSETDRVKKAQELGAGAYVKKPYLMEKLGLAVRKELDHCLQGELRF